MMPDLPRTSTTDSALGHGHDDFLKNLFADPLSIMKREEQLMCWLSQNSDNSITDAASPLSEELAFKAMQSLMKWLNEPTRFDHKLRYKANFFLVKIAGSHDMNLVPWPYYLDSGIEIDVLHSTSSGSYGLVQKGRLNGTKPVAIKTLYLRSDDACSDREAEEQTQWKGFCREVFTWRSLQNRYVLPLLGLRITSELGTLPSMVSPWMENGSICSYLKKRRLQLGEEKIHKLLVECLRGIEYIHSTGCVHGDLHTKNVLISDEGHVLITDFGLACVSASDGCPPLASRSGWNGVIYYKAPELLDPDSPHCRRTDKSDMYAYASICLTAFTGRPQFGDERLQSRVEQYILQGRQPARPAAQINSCEISDEWWQAVKTCLQPVPHDRPSAKELLGKLDHEPAIVVAEIDIAELRDNLLKASSTNAGFGFTFVSSVANYWRRGWLAEGSECIQQGHNMMKQVWDRLDDAARADYNRQLENLMQHTKRLNDGARYVSIPYVYFVNPRGFMEETLKFREHTERVSSQFTTRTDESTSLRVTGIANTRATGETSPPVSPGLDAPQSSQILDAVKMHMKNRGYSSSNALPELVATHWSTDDGKWHLEDVMEIK